MPASEDHLFSSPAETLYDPDDAPPEVLRFQRYWLAALSATAFVGILILPHAIAEFGMFTAMLANLALFGLALALMDQVGRCRSTAARWLLALPFNGLIALYDFTQLPSVTGPQAAVWLVAVQLGLMLYATVWLFAPASRAWFAGSSASRNSLVLHSTVASTWSRKAWGRARPRALAVGRLSTSSNLVAGSTGISAGFLPLSTSTTSRALLPNSSFSSTQ